MKRRTLFATLTTFLLCAVVALTGCSLGEEKKVSDVVDTYLSDIENDSSKVRDIWYESFFTLTEDEETAQLYLSLAFDEATHTIDNVVINDDGTAQVTVTFNSINFADATKQWTDAIGAMTDSEKGKLGAQGANDLFIDFIKSSERRDNMITVDLEKTDDGWVISDEKTFNEEILASCFNDNSLILIAGLAML